MKVYILFKWVNSSNLYSCIEEVYAVVTNEQVALSWLDQDNDNDFYERILDEKAE